MTVCAEVVQWMPYQTSSDRGMSQFFVFFVFLFSLQRAACLHCLRCKFSLFLEHRWNEGREQWSSGCESEWCTEAGKCKTETERLKMQVEAPKNTAQGHRGETRDRDSIMNR